MSPRRPLPQEQLQHLSDEVGAGSQRCWCCARPSGASADRYPNLTVKKIPNHVLTRCEWGHDDYSLNVENLPKAPPKLESEPTQDAASRCKRRRTCSAREEGNR